MSAQRSREDFDEELGRLMGRLHGLALRLTRDRGEAEEVVADTVCKAWFKRGQLRNPRCLEGWLIRILHNTFVSARRRRQALGVELGYEEDSGDAQQPDGVAFIMIPAVPETPEEQCLNHLLQAALQRSLDELPPAYREAIVLTEVHGYTYAETARLLRIPLGTVRSRLNRARLRLRESLRQQAREAGLQGADRAS